MHKYEDTASNDNRIFVDAVDINTSGRLWLLIDHSTKIEEIIVVGEHIGPLEMMWDSENTRGGIVAAFSDDEDAEIWSSSFVGLIEMKVHQTGQGIWKISRHWFSGETKITSRKQGSFEIDIQWPLENGGFIPVQGTITYEKSP